MFKWYAVKALHFIRNAKYKPAKNRLFKIKEGELCACALGQIALGLNLVSEDQAREYAKHSTSDEQPVYELIKDFFKNDDGVFLSTIIPGVNDTLSLSENSPSEKFFNKLADELEIRFNNTPNIRLNTTE